MTPYIIILFFLILYSVLNIYLKQYVRFSQISYFLFFIALTLLAGLRYDIGKDYMSYATVFNRSLYLTNEINEIGWAYFFFFCRNSGIPFELIVLFVAYITTKCAFKYIKQYSPLLFLSILIFFCFGQYYFNTFNAIRQTLVIYFFYSSLEKIKERKFLSYFIGVGLMTFLVHQTAILLLPLYFIINREYTLWFKLIILCCGMVFAGTMVKILSVSVYAVYLELDRYSSEVALTTYILLGISLFFLVIDSRIKKKTPELNILLNLSFLSLFFQCLSILFADTPLIMITNRFSYYFSPVFIVLIPIFIGKLRKSGNQMLLIVLITLFYSLLCCQALIYNGTKNNTVPYKTIFSK